MIYYYILLSLRSLNVYYHCILLSFTIILVDDDEEEEEHAMTIWWAPRLPDMILSQALLWRRRAKWLSKSPLKTRCFLRQEPYLLLPIVTTSKAKKNTPTISYPSIVKHGWEISEPAKEGGFACWENHWSTMWVKQCHVYHPPIITIGGI